MVVVAKVEVPDTERVPLETRDDVAVIVPPVRVLMVAVNALRIEAKKLVVVALDNSVSPLMVSFVMVVVAKVLVPSTVKSDVEVAPVVGLARNDVFCTHATPFQ